MSISIPRFDVAPYTIEDHLLQEVYRQSLIGPVLDIGADDLVTRNIPGTAHIWPPDHLTMRPRGGYAMVLFRFAALGKMNLFDQAYLGLRILRKDGMLISWEMTGFRDLQGVRRLSEAGVTLPIQRDYKQIFDLPHWISEYRHTSRLTPMPLSVFAEASGIPENELFDTIRYQNHLRISGSEQKMCAPRATLVFARLIRPDADDRALHKLV